MDLMLAVVSIFLFVSIGLVVFLIIMHKNMTDTVMQKRQERYDEINNELQEQEQLNQQANDNAAQQHEQINQADDYAAQQQLQQERDITAQLQQQLQQELQQDMHQEIHESGLSAQLQQDSEYAGQLQDHDFEQPVDEFEEY